MDKLLNARNVALVIGLIVAAITLRDYASHQPSLLVLALVFIGCWLFWGWVASLGVSLVIWLQSEIVLMGRFPRISWRPTAFNLAKLVAKIVGLVVPFAAYYPQEGTAVLTNVEHWALVPVTLGICLGLVAVPLWLAIKYGASKIKRTA